MEIYLIKFFLTVQGLLRQRRSPDTSTLERMYCMH